MISGVKPISVRISVLCLVFSGCTVTTPSGALSVEADVYWNSSLQNALVQVRLTNDMNYRVCLPIPHKSTTKAIVQLRDDKGNELKSSISVDARLNSRVAAEAIDPGQSIVFAFPLDYQFQNVLHGQHFRLRYSTWAFSCRNPGTSLYPYPPPASAKTIEIDSGWVDFEAP
jgi:hypothetical protein